jgi:hypothetical protein
VDAVPEREVLVVGPGDVQRAGGRETGPGPDGPP